MWALSLIWGCATIKVGQDDVQGAVPGELDVHRRQRPLVARTRERHQQIHERIERGDSLRAIARELLLSRGTVLRFARAADVEQLLVAATNRPSVIDDYRLYLHHRWMEGCTNAAALTREIQQLGYRGDINTVRRHLRPYRTGTIPADAPLPHLTVRRVTDWIMRRPEQLTDTERKCLDELCERSPALATTTEYARRLAAIVRGARPRSAQTVSQAAACSCRPSTGHFSVSTVVPLKASPKSVVAPGDMITPADST
ncbi:hypothetical protein [Streptomyces acidiscabies]|uniref:hypothetical protein n=1 Tax=Streptomyces acidiscabies TaxID=42234 RepID=UPI0015BEBF18|nr:hypothetical protein [Streptomyces acidiscabies]